ncbi:MAG: hypothetical protein V3V99_02995 [candidate division Zixibacteria bacterium]
MKQIIKILGLAIIIMTLAIPAIADEIAVTVYNSDLGVVRETRSLDFVQGLGKIKFTDVASRIDATSVTFEIVDTTKEVDILEQNYDFDLVNPDKIYNKYIDNNIEIVTEKGELFTGKLLSFSGGYLVIEQTGGKIKTISKSWVRDVTFPDLPEGLITRPTLFWDYQSNFTGPAEAIVGYQTTGIIWHAEYVGILDENDSLLDLTGWVSIDNRSGKTYRDAILKVVAGEIHRARPEYDRGLGYAEMATAVPKKAVGFEEKAFFEYHLYTLPRKATIKNNQIKQISMFEPARAIVKKELRYFSSRGQGDVNVFIKMNNSREVGLGMPLPAGRVRIFKADTDKSLIMLGEDRIDHTPRNEDVKLRIGKAFDVIGETTEVSRRRISDKVTEYDIRIEVRNQKDEPVTVIIERRFGGFWEILNASIDYDKKSASRVEWTLDIEPEEKGVIDFTLRLTRL